MLIEDALHALERIHGASPAVGAMCIVPATFAAIALGAHAVRVVPRRTMPVLEAVHTLPVGGAEQIARAVELGLGAQSPSQIELITDDSASEAFAVEVRGILREG